MGNDILALQEFQRGYLGLLVDDIPEEKMAIQPGGVINHPAWQLGHLSVPLDMAIGKMLGGTSKLDEAWTKRYGRESTPTSDRSTYATKAQLLAVLDERRAEFGRLFKAASSDFMSKPPPDPRAARRFPTMGVFLSFLATTHEATHLGQLAVWRKATGMVQALSKLT